MTQKYWNKKTLNLVEVSTYLNIEIQQILKSNSLDNICFGNIIDRN